LGENFLKVGDEVVEDVNCVGDAAFDRFASVFDILSFHTGVMDGKRLMKMVDEFS
jgi:hypothetical protein